MELVCKENKAIKSFLLLGLSCSFAAISTDNMLIVHAQHEHSRHKLMSSKKSSMKLSVSHYRHEREDGELKAEREGEQSRKGQSERDDDDDGVYRLTENTWRHTHTQSAEEAHSCAYTHIKMHVNMSLPTAVTKQMHNNPNVLTNTKLQSVALRSRD